MKRQHLLGMATTLAAALWSAAALAGEVPTSPPISVPEPGTLSLLAMGLGGLAWVKFRNRK